MQLQEVHPPLPDPVHLIDVDFKSCPPHVCLTVEDAEKLARNKVQVGQWMDKTSNIIRYYRTKSAKPHSSD